MTSATKLGRSSGGAVLGLVLVLLACKSNREEPQAEEPVAAAPQAQPQAAEPQPTPAPVEAPGVPQPVQAGPALGFTLSHSSINQFESVKLTFNQAVNPASGTNWVTIVPVGKPDNDWGEWKYIPKGAKSIELTPKATGALEVRLHDTFPDHKFGVLQRASLNVVASKCNGTFASECDCPGGAKGSMTCDETHGWSACDCPKPKPKRTVQCRDGQTRACPCGDGTFGRQTCDRGKWPSGCFLCD